MSADVDARLEDTSAWANETFLTGVDLSDYALSADVDSRLEDTSAWANETFLTGVDLSDYALSADVDTRLEDTSAWVNDTFVTTAVLSNMLTELSGVLSVKPATGNYMLGTDNGVLTWVPVTLCEI